ncbi:MAG TPA: T9SS type A sorting domain-containing protein [Flavisolibacter sp.]|jgi:hypothetical protein|nr:T9SS type A sorting domain-containing protein [Flavisolibacter sp.]
MKKVVLIGCLCFIMKAATAQDNGRVVAGPIRWGMNGSVEAMPGALAATYGRNDTLQNYRRNLPAPRNNQNGNPNAVRFTSAQALCNDNSIQFSWSVLQQPTLDFYTIEQSSNGRDWSEIGTIPASTTRTGESPYSFQYNKYITNAVFRVVATNKAGEQIQSSILESPCSYASALSVTPNPVVSTTNLKIGTAAATKVKLTLVDMQGTIWMSKDVNLAAGTNSIPIDLSGRATGTYSLLINWYTGRQETITLLKQ